MINMGTEWSSVGSLRMFFSMADDIEKSVLRVCVCVCALRVIVEENRGGGEAL